MYFYTAHKVALLALRIKGQKRPVSRIAIAIVCHTHWVCMPLASVSTQHADDDRRRSEGANERMSSEWTDERTFAPTLAGLYSTHLPHPKITAQKLPREENDTVKRGVKEATESNIGQESERVRHCDAGSDGRKCKHKHAEDGKTKESRTPGALRFVYATRRSIPYSISYTNQNIVRTKKK